MSSFISCDKLSKGPQEDLDTSILKANEVEFLHSTLWLPPEFEKLTYEELFEVARETNDDWVNMLLQSSKEYRDKDEKPVFFRSTIMPSNFIGIYPRPYFQLTKQQASYYISDFARTLKRQDKILGRTSEIIEKRIKRFGGHTMVKLKVNMTFDFNQNQHFTQYFISGNSRSFMVMQVDVLQSDYELNLKKLSLGSK